MRAVAGVVIPLLHQAAERGDAAQLRQLLARGAGTDVRDAYGQTALMRAAHGGFLDAARVLLESGAALDTTGLPNIACRR